MRPKKTEISPLQFEWAKRRAFEKAGEVPAGWRQNIAIIVPYWVAEAAGPFNDYISEGEFDDAGYREALLAAAMQEEPPRYDDALMSSSGCVHIYDRRVRKPDGTWCVEHVCVDVNGRETVLYTSC